ncbi:unnamed protein product [Effrenium voratum]|nr:unnamed protein product [Effrenium voratum]
MASWRQSMAALTRMVKEAAAAELPELHAELLAVLQLVKSRMDQSQTAEAHSAERGPAAKRRRQKGPPVTPLDAEDLYGTSGLDDLEGLIAQAAAENLDGDFSMAGKASLSASDDEKALAASHEEKALVASDEEKALVASDEEKALVASDEEKALVASDEETGWVFLPRMSGSQSTGASPLQALAP